MRVSVRVQPRARRAAVGGRYGTTEPPVLVVRVTEPAVDGRANRACLDALAEALGVPKNSVSIVAGATSRTKLVEIPGAEPHRLEVLLQR